MNTIEKTYCRFFVSKLHAQAHCTVLNRNLGIEYYRVIEGPEDNWAVVDRETAEEFNVLIIADYLRHVGGPLEELQVRAAIEKAEAEEFKEYL